MKTLFSLFVVGLLSLSCANPGRSAEFQDLGPFLDSLILANGIPGIGFAVFDDSGVLFQHVSGVKSQITLEPVDEGTVFEAASISKPLFAYVVFSLAQDGVLDLDAPLHTLVPEVPDLAYDPRSEALTPRMLLTHRGGLPNWRSRINFEAQNHAELFAPDDTLRFVSDPDTDYRYSGEGYVLLQRVVEERTGRSLDDLAREKIFDPLRMTRSSFRFDDAMRRNFSSGHNLEGNPDKWELQVQLASSTLHTTASDLAMFGAHLASEIRDRGPYSALAVPATVDTLDGLERGWGPGLGTVADGSGRYVYHGGNNVIFIADFMYGIDENLGYVLLTNSASGARMIDAVESRIFGRAVRR